MKDNTMTKPHLHGNQAQSLGLRSFGSSTLTRPGKTLHSETIELCNCIWRRQSHFNLVCPIAKARKSPHVLGTFLEDDTTSFSKDHIIVIVTFAANAQEWL